MFDLYWTGPTTAKTDVSGRIITPYGSFWVPNMQVYTLLLRRKNAALKQGVSDNMLDAEHDILDNFLRTCFQSALTGVQLDPAKLRAALTDALRAKWRPIPRSRWTSSRQRLRPQPPASLPRS